MSELLAGAGGIGIYILVAAFLLWLAYYLFGPQALGVPAFIGVLVIFALWQALPSLGVLTIAAFVAGVLVLFIVIGMAMSLGAEKPPKAHDEKPPDEQ